MKKVKSILFLMIGICLLSITNVKAYTYTIKYNANGGSGKVSNQSIKSSTWSALNANKFTKKGYTFVGWNTTKDSKGIGFRNKQEVYNLVNKAGSKTLYAMWTKTKYTIKYNLNGGTNNSSNPSKYYITTDSITLKNPTKKGYIFKGWYKESTFKTKVTSIKKGSVGNITLYAKWSPITYTVKYDVNGGTGSMTSSTNLKYNTSYNLKANTYTRNGYTFAGWNTKANGSGKTYAENASIKNLTSVNGKTITLYAKWQKVKYTITYELNGGINSNSNPSYYYVNSSKIILNSPTKEGYTFAGWYLTADFNKNESIINTGSTGNKTYYAKWEDNQYSIMFHSNFPDDEEYVYDAMLNINYSDTYNLTANTLNLDGYKFVGWNTKADRTGTFYEDEAEISKLTTISGEIVDLYAMWDKLYTIEFVLENEDEEFISICSYQDIMYSYVNEPDILTTEQKYYFDGWYTDETFSTKFEFGITEVTGDITIYGKRVDESKINIGTELSIKVDDNHTEQFYIIDDDGTYLYAFAKNNLYVGSTIEHISDYVEETPILSSDENYLYQAEEANDIYQVSGISFASENYWTSEDKYKDKYYNYDETDIEPYIYDENSSIYPYLTEYATRLSNNVNVSASLISYEQLQQIDCLSQDTCNYNWIYNANYWTGSSDLYMPDFIGYIGINEESIIHSGYISLHGIRPVIKIEKSKLNLDNVENGIEI